MRIGAQAGVPESEFFDSQSIEIASALFVVSLIFGEAVLASVEFDAELGLFAEEVQCVRSDRMLAAKFVGAESAVAQPFPKQAFGPAGGFAELSRAQDFG